MKKFNLKKALMLGTLALAIAIPAGAGAASAASSAGNSITQDQVTQFAGRYGIDLNALIQQLLQGKYPGSGQTTQPTQPTKPTQPAQPAQPSKPSTGSGNTGSNAGSGTNAGTSTETATSAFASQVVTLVNQERAKAGLKALNTSNATLTKMALDKAKDMYNKGYFDHNSPTYGSPFDMMKQYGINYRYAGENIAKGQRTPQEVMTAWMNSPGHRANILSANFTTIGVAYYNGVWVQEFIS
ncbi:CAP domain-containing protein [Cohnella boryungensis]|uniref:CAP domain-containing protein n=1 Tax=Cohnella boryungensis TaxID=768479 RepID=A0ABV8S7G0_9BACL